MSPFSPDDDQHRSRTQLIDELQELRCRVAALKGNGNSVDTDARQDALQWFQAIFENTPHVAIQGFDRDGVVTHWNQASRQLYGYSAKEAIGRRLHDLILTGESSRKFDECLKNICLTGLPAPGSQWQTVNRDGDLIWVYSTMFPIFDKGVVADIFCMDVDITERIRSEEELRKARLELEERVRARTEALELTNVSLIKEIAVRKEYEAALGRSENFLENIFNCIQDGITIMDRDLNIISANNAMEERYSSKLPLPGKKCYFVYHGRSEPCENCSGIRAIETGNMQAHIIPYTGNNGTKGWREVHSFPFKDASGAIVGVISMVRDVTRRKTAEEELEFERSQLLSIFDSIDQNIYVSDPLTYEILYANRKMREQFKKDLVGRICYKELQGRARPCEFCNNEAILKDKDRPVIWEFHNKKVDRQYVITDRIIKWPDGRDVRLEIANDITERKKVEEDLLQAKSDAELYVDLMGHDINNMNQVGIGYLELANDILMLEGKLDKEHSMLLLKPLESLENSSKLINNVRKIQRERHGGYEAKVIDVDSLLMEVIPRYSSIAERDVTIDYAPRDKCRVKANDLLKDVFLNLIGNAVKHSNGPVSIGITQELVEHEGRKLCKVAFEDNGPGIPDALKKTLFDRLNLVNTRARGKGFGLCLIKMLVDDYGGMFSVEDRVNGDYSKGARFIVTLPAV